MADRRGFIGTMLLAPLAALLGGRTTPDTGTVAAPGSMPEPFAVDGIDLEQISEAARRQFEIVLTEHLNGVERRLLYGDPAALDRPSGVLRVGRRLRIG